ncbi:hypothetical protein [Vibrio vulnificus]|uniref:hypothetical protein n=1 Tax=Vibrio vulnificus TaxID=672 RepID=UPI004058E0C4
MSSTELSITSYSLEDLTEKENLSWAVGKIHENLDKGNLTGIANAFYENTKIGKHGVPFIKIKGLTNILRTGDAGNARYIVDHGYKNVLSSPYIVTIDGDEYISGPSLVGLIQARIGYTLGTTKQYLDVAYIYYQRIIDSPSVRDLKEKFLLDITKKRSDLKSKRIDTYGITKCELSGATFVTRGVVDFAHIDSVFSHPEKALDIDNGLIILGRIHRELTSLHIHDFSGLYDFCKANGYSTAWA